MSAAAPRLCCIGIRKAFPGVVALDDVSIEVAAGSVHAIVGENGAGKSTLMKVLSGALLADAGTVCIDGAAVRLRDSRCARQQGIAIVHQEFNLANDLSVSENIYLGYWPTSPVTRMIDFPRLHRDAAKLLAMLGISLPLRRPVGSLTVAQQQMVEIAKALSQRARIVILDEPSAVLTPHELRALFTTVRDMKRRGTSVVYISHRLEEVFEIADAVTVLRDGRHVSTRPIQDVTRGRLIAEMVGRPLTDDYPRRSHPIGDVLLRLDGLTAKGRFCDVSFEVRAGEVFALTGLVGSGRSSIARCIFGDVRASGGLRVGGSFGPFAHPRQAIAAGVAMLPENRKQDGLLPARSVRENITLANRAAAATAGLIRADRERRLARKLMDKLHIKAAGTEQSVATLSGGNQQKVLLARWLSRPHKLVVFDEPTRGVDVGGKFEIYTLINGLARSGVAVLMISSELPEVIGMADRIGVMHEGRLAGLIDNRRQRATQEQILRLAAGEAEPT